MTRTSLSIEPLARGPFLVSGLALWGLKLAIDWSVALLFKYRFSPLFYVSPLDAPLFRPGDNLSFWLSMWGVAIPFMGIGVWLTLRRLRDAGLPPWLAVLFFFPFANLLFFAALASLASRPSQSASATGSPTGTRADALFARAVVQRNAVVVSVAAGACTALVLGSVVIFFFKSYGAALFMGTPFLVGAVATLTMHRASPARPRRRATLVAALASGSLALLVMILFAIDGLVCFVMASPLAVLAITFGWFMAEMIVKTVGLALPETALCVFPFVLIAELAGPVRKSPPAPVVTMIEVDAPSNVVFRNVIEFPDLPPFNELIFKLGVAAPLGATIKGQGVGAVRHCRFTTGAFVEPITVWDAPHKLGFDVRSQPDALRELTLWGGPRPPHLNDYFKSVRGEFELVDLPNRRTQLIGRTYYVLDIAPEPYWRLISDSLVHSIHLRVLKHVKRLSERDR